mgnify:CR=1 FL=1
MTLFNFPTLVPAIITTKLLFFCFNFLVDSNTSSKFFFGWNLPKDRKTVFVSFIPKKLFKLILDLKLEILCKPYITKKNDSVEFDIFVNDSFNKNIKLTNKNQGQKIEILIEKKLVKNNEIKVDFNFKNPISPYEVLESPDSRKLGILVKNIIMSPI